LAPFTVGYRSPSHFWQYTHFWAITEDTAGFRKPAVFFCADRWRGRMS
jgi:hypothetical protein